MLRYRLHKDRMVVSVHTTPATIILSFTIIARVDFIAGLAHIDSIFHNGGLRLDYDERIF